MRFRGFGERFSQEVKTSSCRKKALPLKGKAESRGISPGLQPMGTLLYSPSIHHRAGYDCPLTASFNC
jgi:hypothetical protein